MSDHIADAQNAKSWPFQEARALLKRLNGKAPKKGYVLFETGYGPSGLPHIGTFGEVARTTMVKRAFEILAPDIPTKLFCFSDDMDGLRKVPDNIPNGEIIEPHLGKSLTQVPDPFGCHDSFGLHNNTKLREFLDSFGFDYDFKSATDLYKAGDFDETLLAVLKNYDAVMNVILPTLGAERQATYSPFLPVCPETGIVLQVPMEKTDPENGTISYRNEKGDLIETPVTGGHCKLQWKVDWAMRWTALEVDYEMSGKDLMESVKLSSKICKILGGRPPQGLTYEMFLDQNGEKISKSKGNGLTMEEWLTYAPHESLSLFMFQKPKTAKRLYFDVIPRMTDEYLGHLRGYKALEEAKKIDNPAFHIHGVDVPGINTDLTFSMMLNLVSVAHSDDPATIWHYVSRYEPGATPEKAPLLDRLVKYAIAYYADFVKPHKTYATPDDVQKAALTDLRNALEKLPEDADPQTVQSAVYEIGKAHEFASLKEWFKLLYTTLLGQETGPRMGGFFALYGLKESIALIDTVLSGKKPD